VGAVRGQLQGSFANILGYGDILAAQYGRSQGLNDGYVGYSLPIASDDTRLSLRYDRNGVVVITSELSPLNTTSSFSSVGVGLSRPMYRTPEQTFTLGVSFERRQQQTFLLGMPFPFTAGAEPNGKTVVTPVRLYQDWLDRDAEHAFAARSTLSFGIQSLGATVDRNVASRHTDSEILLLARPGAICAPDLRGLGNTSSLRPPARQPTAFSDGADRVRQAWLGARLSHVSDGDG
jgi:hemolysin activation/secretion protein